MANSSFYTGNPTPAQVASLEALVAQVTLAAEQVILDADAAEQSALDAAAAQGNSEASATASATAAGLAQTALSNATAAATASQGHATNSSNSATASAGSATNALASLNLTITYRDETNGFRTDAMNYANTALTYRNDAEGFKNAAAASAAAAATFDPTNFYTKVQADARYYTKTEIDTNTYTQTQTNTLLNAKAPLASPAFTGTATFAIRPTFAGNTPWDSNNLLVSSLLPAGILGEFLSTAAPTGWLKANGALVQRSTYSALDTAIYCGDANNATALWGYRTNSTDTTRSISGTHFRLPDFRGEFLRGWDDSRGIDSGRSLWAAQAGEVQSHTHTATASGEGNHQHANNVGSVSGYATSGPDMGAYGTTGNGGQLTAPAGAHGHTITVNAAGGAETRPRNLAVLICIKF